MSLRVWQEIQAVLRSGSHFALTIPDRYFHSHSPKPLGSSQPPLHFTGSRMTGLATKRSSGHRLATPELPPETDIRDRTSAFLNFRRLYPQVRTLRMAVPMVRRCEGFSDACRGWACAANSVGRRRRSLRGRNRGGIRRGGAGGSVYGDLTAATACTRAKSPYVTLYTRGFSHFVTSMTAPIASGRSDSCRVGLAPTEERRLITAHTQSGHRARWPVP